MASSKKSELHSRMLSRAKYDRKGDDGQVQKTVGRRQAGLLIPRPLREPQDVPLPTNTQKSRPARSGELSLLSRARETKPFTARPGTEGTCRVNHSAALCRRCSGQTGVGERELDEM